MQTSQAVQIFKFDSKCGNFIHRHPGAYLVVACCCVTDIRASTCCTAAAPVCRLNYRGGPGEEGYVCKVTVTLITKCQYKDHLLGTGQQSLGVLQDCRAGLSQVSPRIVLQPTQKENSVCYLWNTAVKESEAQQELEDKEQHHHFWYNGSALLRE